MNKQIIKELQQQNFRTQEKVYKEFAARMFRICYRYLGNEADAAEVLNDGFYKIFTKINSFKDSKGGDFEAWMRRIMVNESLQFIRKKRKLKFVDINGFQLENEFVFPENNLETEDIYTMIRDLPDVYRVVFNLYVIDGFSHDEIAEKMNVAESTSRSHLFRARKLLKELMEDFK